MSNETEVLLILARPQISIDLTTDGEVIIRTYRIADDYETVAHDSVVIPIDLAVEIGNALLRIAVH